MQKNYLNWRHVFKLDPDKAISDEALEAVCTSGTDAIMIGGTQGVTFDNTVELLGRVRRYALDCVLEVSSVESVVPGFDDYHVPFVLNARYPDWIMAIHRRGIEAYGAVVPWERVVMEGYIILNPDSAAAKLTEADCSLTEEAVISYAIMAERMFRFPVVYIEYSGKLGDRNLVGEIRSRLKHARLFYGGGIANAEAARQMAEAADTIVVGNAIYDDLKAALSTVEAVKNGRV